MCDPIGSIVTNGNYDEEKELIVFTFINIAVQIHD